MRTAGGTPSQKAVYAEEGTPLLEALEGVTAEKEGLVFGAWLMNGRELTESDVMPEDGVIVTARYKARYTVEVRKENARGNGYDISAESALGWEGSTVQPEAPAYAHFTLEEALSSSGPLTLRAGENTYIFTYSREPLSLRFEANVPAGSTAGGAMQELTSRYQGIQALPDCAFEAKGYTFLGWAEHPSASEFYEEGEEYALGEEDATLYAVWAKAYEDACREGGTLLVAHNAEEDGSYLALVKEPSRIEGSYDAAKNALTLGGQNGRLEHGHYLLDDSGTYTGYDLAANSVNTALGVLTLDFSAGRAVYSHGGREESGSYLYLFDEEAGEYSGHYEFYAGTTRFAFGLDREKGVFLPEGKEGGEYRLYDCAEDAFTGETLTLDGFGKAELSGEREGLRYRGAGGKNEWLVSLRDGSELQVLLGIREQSVGGIVFESESVCLVFRPEFAGTFSSAFGTLSLDGYGTSAVYTYSGGSVQGSYAATGSLVTLFAGEETLRFVLDGSTFSPAGEGAGYFEGEKGLLFLDGAGNASLTLGERTVTGVCTPLSSGDYTFDGEESFRFRTEGSRYTVFDERIFGVFETLGGGLSLDGYGGGTYLSVTEGSHEVTVTLLGDVFEVSSEAFPTLTGTLTFTVDRTTGTIGEVAAAEAGRYALVGTDAAAIIRLDGSGGAELYDGEGSVLASGSYTYDAFTQRGTFALGIEGDFALSYFRFRLRTGAECILFGSSPSGSYFGENASLVLDGYGGGTLTRGSRSVYGEIEGEGDSLRLCTEDTVYLLTLSGNALLSAEAFTRYEGAEGALFVGSGTAFTEGGSPRPFTAAGNGEYLLGSGASAKRVLLEGGRWYVFREGLQGTAQTAEGTLTLDGFGRGSYATPAGVLSCEVVYASGRYLELDAGGNTLCIALDGRGGFAVGSVSSIFRTL